MHSERCGAPARDRPEQLPEPGELGHAHPWCFALQTQDMGKFRGFNLEPRAGDSVTWYKSARNPFGRKRPNLKFLPRFARMLIDWEFFPEYSKVEMGW